MLFLPAQLTLLLLLDIKPLFSITCGSGAAALISPVLNLANENRPLTLDTNDLPQGWAHD